MIIYTSLSVPAGATATEMRAGVWKLSLSAGKIFLFQIFFYVWCPSEQYKVSEKIVGDVLQPPEPTASPAWLNQASRETVCKRESAAS